METMARPTVMTPEVLQKLEDAYLCDATHLQAAIYAGIAEHTLHDYRKAHPEFSQRIDDLRGMTTFKAKLNIKKSIDSGDKHDSKWHLERREKDYMPKQKNEVEHSGNKSLLDAILAKKGCGKHG
jgi:hypothetical protein